MSIGNEGAAAGPHIGESAELYALGALEPAERDAIDAHVATCSSCLRALGDAERTVAALVDEFVEPVDPPASLGARIAASARAVAPAPVARARVIPFPQARAAWLAAAIVVAAGSAGGALVEHAADVRAAASQSAVLATLANSHFLHVSLSARRADAPVSKAIYARDGAWVYVIVDRASCACRVVARTTAGPIDLGAPETRGTTATLFTRAIARPTSVALVDAAGQILSDATLSYASP
jgi:anti-sigma factor RsiW